MTVPPVWLTRQAYELLQQELAELLQDRSRRPSMIMSVEGAGHIDRDNSPEQPVVLDERGRNHRIRRLQEILLNSFVEQDVPDDGVAEPGMVLTARYGNDSEIEIETFLLAHRVPVAYGDVEVCSPDSPLGRALCGAREGEWRRYSLPDGRTATVQLIRAVPYRTGSAGNALHETATSSPADRPPHDDRQVFDDEIARRRQRKWNIK